VASGSIKASYGLFDGSAQASAEQIKSLGESMCAASASDNAAATLGQKASDFINDASLSAFNECKRLEANLRVATQFVDYPSVNGIGLVSFTVSYSPSIGITQRAKIQSIEILPAGAFNCRGPLWTLTKPQVFTEESLSMDCERKIDMVAKPILSDPGAPLVHAPEATITVYTSAGDIRRSVPAIYPPPVPKPTIDPIGSVIAYSGPIDQTSVLPTGWLPCDGRVLSKDSYPQLFSVLGTRYGEGKDSAGSKTGDFNLPDYRGFFLRGLDKGTPNSRDEERRASGKDVGSLEEDTFKHHGHTVTFHGSLIGQGAPTPASGGFSSGNEYGPSTGYASLTVNEEGKDETRPKNIAVNYLIRVR
jgi:microcystin-dependent protein